MLKYIIFLLNLFYQFRLIDNKELDYSNLNNILLVVEFIDKYFLIVKILIKDNSLMNNFKFRMFLKDILNKKLDLIIVNNDLNLLNKFIFYSNEFKYCFLSYKKDLLNYNPNTYFKVFNSKIYMINFYSNLHYLDFKNSNDNKSFRIYLIDKTFYNDFLKLSNNNPLFLFDFYLSYFNNNDKKQLKSIKNYNLKEFKFSNILDKTNNYYFKLRIDYDLNKFNQDNDYLLYLIDYFYSYEFLNNSKNYIDFLIEFLKFLEFNNYKLEFDLNSNICNNSKYYLDLVLSLNPNSNGIYHLNLDKKIKVNKSNDIIKSNVKNLLNNIHLNSNQFRMNIKLKRILINRIKSIDNTKDFRIVINDLIYLYELFNLNNHNLFFNDYLNLLELRYSNINSKVYNFKTFEKIYYKNSKNKKVEKIQLKKNNELYSLNKDLIIYNK